MYNTNHLITYTIAFFINIIPLVSIFYFRKFIDKIALLLWIYFLVSFFVEFSQIILLVGFNKHHTLGHYFCIFPGLLFTFLIFEIVFEKKIFKSIIYAISFTFILLIITLLDSESKSNFFADFVFNLQILIICLIYIFKSLNANENLFQNQNLKLKSIFIFFTLIYFSVYIFVGVGWEFFYLEGIDRKLGFYNNLLVYFNLLVFNLSMTWILIQVAKRNNAGKITFGANAVE